MSVNEQVAMHVVPQTESLKCASCKQTVAKNGVKCKLCPKVFHLRCGGRIKVCCEEELTTLLNINNPEVIVDEIIQPNIQITTESSKEEVLMKLIAELEAKNSILIENSNLLKYKIVKLESEVRIKNSEIKELKKTVNNLKSEVNDETDANDKHIASSGPLNSNVMNDPRAKSFSKSGETSDLLMKIPTNTSNQTIHSFTLSEVSKAVSTASAQYSEVVNKQTKTKDNNMEGDKYEWKKVQRKRKPKTSERALVVGSYAGSTTIEGIEKYKILHVSNLKPDTTVDGMTTFLKQNFTDVKCEAIQSRYPDCYASFKVMIPSSQFQKALEGTSWPNRASVHYFRQRRPSNQRHKNEN